MGIPPGGTSHDLIREILWLQNAQYGHQPKVQISGPRKMERRTDAGNDPSFILLAVRSS